MDPMASSAPSDEAVIRVASAARGVTQVIERCEAAKTSGYLDLSCCSLMYLADAIYLVLKGYEVTKVSLRANDFKKFPKKLVAKFPNVTICNCEGNQISEIPEELAEWTKIKGLNAANNALTEVPPALLAMKNMAILDLSGNKIQEVDASLLFSSFPSLMQINLAGNPLSDSCKAALLAAKPPNVAIRVQ